jgi:hypothetical protein
MIRTLLVAVILLSVTATFAYEDAYDEEWVCKLILEGSEPRKVIMSPGTMTENSCQRLGQVQLFMNSSHYRRVSYELLPPADEEDERSDEQ